MSNKKWRYTYKWPKIGQYTLRLTKMVKCILDYHWSFILYDVIFYRHYKYLPWYLYSWLFYYIVTRLLDASKGIRQWPINLSSTSMILHKITPSVDYNQWLKRVDWTLNLIYQPIKIYLSPQSCKANDYENVIIKFWGLPCWIFSYSINMGRLRPFKSLETLGMGGGVSRPAFHFQIKFIRIKVKKLFLGV